MRLSWFRFLSQLNKLLLPQIQTKPDLSRLNGFEKAVVGWKLWVTYRRLDAESAQAVTTADNKAKATLGR